jgi:hypothetical protein
MGRLDEKHAFTGKDVAAVIDDLNQDFDAVDVRVEP